MVERLLTPHSHLSIPLPPSFHPPVSCLLSVALRPYHLGDTPDHQGPGVCLGLAGDGLHHGNKKKRCWSGWGSGAVVGLVVGTFYAVAPGRRVKVWLNVVMPWHSKYIGMWARWPVIWLIYSSGFLYFWAFPWLMSITKPWNHYEEMAFYCYSIDKTDVSPLPGSEYDQIMLLHYVSALAGRRFLYHPP